MRERERERERERGRDGERERERVGGDLPVCFAEVAALSFAVVFTVVTCCCCCNCLNPRKQPSFTIKVPK